MKKVFSLLLCLALCAAAIGSFGGFTASADAGPVLKPLAVTVIPLQYGAPRITKNPTDEWVNEYGRCQFVSRYENAILAEWHFVSPDGWRDLTYLQAEQEFPPLQVIMGNTKDMTLTNIPYSLNGWRVYCRFSNYSGTADTAMARITVAPGSGGSSYPRPTGDAMIVYYSSGASERVSAYSDGSWRTSAGTVYYMGTDGVLHSGGRPDLYTYVPGSGGQQPAGNVMVAYYSNGSVEYLTPNSDGTWRTAAGLTYTMGTDGVLRTKSGAELYTYDISGTPRPTGTALTAYSVYGVSQQVYSYSDGTWRTSEGITYYMGTDGVLRATGYQDLYTYNPNHTPSYTPPSSSSYDQQYAGEWRFAFTAGGARVTLNSQGDGTWKSDTGIIYYQGSDGVLRARGAEDLYFR